ncbi:MAG TPA: ubiquinol-cytochrome c reductase iron-sulfur subunit [Anaerolineales bacterium]|nr:ubiquinol-cytochrome c reductase iron-sulfur subunit [Anaerolineales bacterium]
MGTSQEGKMSRRDFMKAAIVGIGGVIGAAIGLPAIAYIVGPALKQTTDTWIRLGAVNKVELSNPTLFKTTIETQTGWINTQEELSAYVLTENGQNFVVMSNICTHLGCRVRWIADKQGFFCPCHNGVFAKDGTVISGPPPRPLDQFQNKVEDGILYIKRG